MLRILRQRNFGLLWAAGLISLIGTANAVNGLNNQLARIIDPAIGGVAVALGGLAAVAVVDAISFLVAAVLLLAIRSDRGRAHVDATRTSLARFVRSGVLTATIRRS